MIVAVVACEIAFWVVLAAGLMARYVLRRPGLGATLLVCVPLVDLMLLAVSVVDIRRGSAPRAAHGLAAAYLGFSIVWGRSLVRWADVRVAHRWAGGPAPTPKPRGGTAARAAFEWREYGRALVAAGITVVLLYGADVLVGHYDDPSLLRSWAGRLASVLVIWLIFFPVWETARAQRR